MKNLKMSRLLLMSVTLIMLTGCFGSIQEDFVDGSRALHDRIAIHYTAYVNGDSELPDSLKRKRLELLTEWERLIKRGEESLDDGEE